MKSLISILFLTTISAFAMAHPGHDHTLVTAGLDHVLYYAGFALAIVGGIAIVKRAVNGNSKHND